MTTTRPPLNRQVWPASYDTKALDVILGGARKTREMKTVLVVRCPAEHVLAEVFRVQDQLVYVAKAEHPLLGMTELVAEDGKLVGRTLPAPPGLTHRRDEYVEAIDLAEKERPPPLRGGFSLPAQCKCLESRRIPLAWLRDKLTAGGWVTFEG